MSYDNWMTLGAPEDVDLKAWEAYVRAIRDSLSEQWLRTKQAYFTLQEIRQTFGLQFIVDPVTTEAAPPPGAWTTDLQNQMLRLQSVVEVLTQVATDVLDDKRQLAWDAAAGDFVIEKLPNDPITVQLMPTAPSGQLQPQLVDAQGAVVQPTGDVQPLGVALAPIAWVGIAAVVAVGVYFVTESICEAVEKVAEQKTMETLGQQQHERVMSGKATPEESSQLTQALYKGVAAVKQAEAEAAKQDPTSQLASTARTLGFVALGIGVIYLGAQVLSRRAA